MTELKQCPFCGRKPYLIMKDHEHFPHPVYMIMCDYENGGCGVESLLYANEKMASQMWNRRAGEDG